MSKICTFIIITIIITFLNSCTENPSYPAVQNSIDTTLKMTFIEFGADWCIPCKEMRPVMDSIQKKYGSQILVKFVDAIKNSSEANKYKIEAMPTQVFLDSNYIEIHRHIGFYSEDSIHLFLQSKGLKIINY